MFFKRPVKSTGLIIILSPFLKNAIPFFETFVYFFQPVVKI